MATGADEAATVGGELVGGPDLPDGSFLTDERSGHYPGWTDETRQSFVDFMSSFGYSVDHSPGKVPLTDDQLISAIRAVPEDRWCESLLEGRPMSWLPLVEVTESHLWVGLTAEGKWAIGRKSGAVVVYEDESISPALITVLEKPIDELSAEFRAKFA